jgi:2,4-dienoyl-CoA reductase-like NADH-dependent reductase (Old Yellow Enzyme family)/thioredoxin reductase
VYELNHMFSPLRIGHLTIRNRFIVSPMVVNYCTHDGHATDTYIAYHEERARGGWGLIVTEDHAVDPAGKGFVYLAGLWDDSHISGHSAMTERVHAQGAKILAQIYHAGRQTTRDIIGVQPVAPSAVFCPSSQEMPRELAVEEVERIVEQFGDAGLRAKKAGFDGIEIHGGHGYLVSEFLSPYSNKRFDKYGGTLINRVRFARDIVRNIREKCGDDFVIQCRLSGDELVMGGRTIEDTKAIAMLLEQAGVDSLDISVGTDGSFTTQLPPPAFAHGWITDYAEAVKAVVSIPVFAVGRINDPFLAESIVASGKADGVLMGRGSLADPHLPNKAREGRFQDIIQCTACLQGCGERVRLQLPVRCVLNPRTGREIEFAITPAPTKKKVFVAGGGPAGMEAAIVAAQRGHEVTLFEASTRLGGQFYLASVPPTKGEIASFLAWQVHTLAQLGVVVKTDTPLTVDRVRAEKPTSVIVATGSTPSRPAIPGIDLDFVTTAGDVLEGNAVTGERVAIIGGGVVGCETANHLAQNGKKPTIIEMLPELGHGEPEAIRSILVEALRERGAEWYLEAVVVGVTVDRSVTIVQHGVERKLAGFDTVVLACGMRPVNDLATELEGEADTIVCVGDAKEARTVFEAVEEGYEAGLML